jgi:hypothetical protein
LIALGTPVFLVTFPATLAIWQGVSFVMRAIAAVSTDPNGEDVNKLYDRWHKIDAAGGGFWATTKVLREEREAELQKAAAKALEEQSRRGSSSSAF